MANVTYVIKKEYYPLSQIYTDFLPLDVSHLPVNIIYLGNTSRLVVYKSKVYSVSIKKEQDLFSLSVIGEHNDVRARKLFDLFIKESNDLADLGPTNLSQTIPMAEIGRMVNLHFWEFNQYLAKMN